jgi:tetratricopeptide (TPR) repeat protein
VNAVPGSRREQVSGDVSFLLTTVQSKISCTPQERRGRGLKVLFTCALCLVVSTLSAAAQEERPCVPAKTFAQVGALLQRQDYSRAKSLLRALESCPHLAPLERFNIGWLYGRAHDSPDALRIFHSVQADVPDRLTHGYAIALADFELGKLQASIDTLVALRVQGIVDAKCADLLGVSYSKLDRYQDAYAVMAENIRQNPSNPFAYFNLIALFVDTSEMDKAAQVADKAVAALPQNADALSMRGSIELYRNQTGEAYRDFSTAAELTPQSPDPLFFMALLDYRQSKFDQAAKLLRDAIASGIADSDLHYMLAECVLRSEPSDARTALTELDQAIQLNPKSVAARILRGERLLAGGRPQDAIIDLKIARELDPHPQRDTSNTTYLLGRAYAALGKRDQANALFAQLGHQFTPSKTDTLNQLGYQKIQAELHP